MAFSLAPRWKTRGPSCRRGKPPLCLRGCRSAARIRTCGHGRHHSCVQLVQKGFSAWEDLLNQCSWPGPRCTFVALVFGSFVEQAKLETRALLSPNTF